MGRKEGEQFQKAWVKVEAMALVRALALVAELAKKFADPDLVNAWVAKSYLQGEAGKAPAANCFGEPIFDANGDQVGIRRPDPREVGIEGIEEFALGLAKIDHEDSWSASVNPDSGSSNAPTLIDYVDSKGYKDWEIVRTYVFDFNDKHNLPILHAVISLGKRERGGEWERVFENALKYDKYPINDEDAVCEERSLTSARELHLHQWRVGENSSAAS